MFHLGIDLGTTNSTAAVFDGEKITLVRNAQGGPLTPSVVRIDGRGGVIVGARARRFLDSDPANTRAEFKRLMGTAESFHFPAANVRRTPQDLAAEVLRSLREDVREQLGFLPETAVITVPALFEVPQSSATAQAAELAGFSKVELLQEPVASALAAGWTSEDSAGRWLVYDLGGGTFDVSLLESEGGLLRVVGHDGDNFLGGRDIDQAIVEWAIGEIARSGGPALSRKESRWAPSISRLKQASEEAKIELGRSAQASLFVPAIADGFDVDLQLTRDVLDRLAAPVIDRSIAVCERLLAAHHMKSEEIARIVLVGGPTAIPLLRARLAERLRAPFADRLDPMTLVAQGAAIHAATMRLDATPPTAGVAPRPAHRKLWLRYPAVSSDLTPHVVGKVRPEAADAAIARVRFERADGGWKGPEVEITAEGTLLAQVDLLPRRTNEFLVRAFSKDGKEIPVDPARIVIVQGLTIADPPLSRTTGVARADDTVHEYFERGCPLPARRTFALETVESMRAGDPEQALRVPIVQGESQRAHLCRLVGALEIRASELTAPLPLGSTIEVTLELDRGGRLSASALAPGGQVFSKVAQLVTPDVAPQALRQGLATLQERLETVRAQAFQQRDASTVQTLSDSEARAREIVSDIDAAEGGDADAAQRARRNLIELDEMLEAAEAGLRWPQVEERAQRELSIAWSWCSAFGTPSEQRVLEETVAAIERARARRDAADLERQVQLIRSIRDASFFRSPDAWKRVFEDLASRADAASDLPKAQDLVRRGRAAVQRRDDDELRALCQELRSLLPADEKHRRLGWDSGVR